MLLDWTGRELRADMRGAFRITWPRSWSGWGSIDRTGWKPSAASVDYSSRRRADRAHSTSMPWHAARGGWFQGKAAAQAYRARHGGPLARHRALNRHLHDAFTRKARQACALTSLPCAVPTGQDEPFEVTPTLPSPRKGRVFTPLPSP